MADKIPDDIYEAARSVAMRRLLSDRADSRDDEMTRNIARAILAEREAATKAERERCAAIVERAELQSLEWVSHVLKDELRQRTAAAIRKGDGE